MRHSIPYILLIQVLLISCLVSTSTEVISEPEPFLALDRIVFPSDVFAGQEFTINVSVIYSCRQRTMMNVGVYNYNSEVMMDPRVFFLEGNGSKSFLFYTRAPLGEGELEFEALLRYWHLGGWIYRNETLHRRFIVRVSEHVVERGVEVIIILPKTAVSSETIKWSGTEAKPDQSGLVRIRAEAGRYLVEIPQTIYIANNTRLNFLRWHDGSRSNPRIVEIEKDVTLTPQYETEHYLLVTSEIGEVYGGGWYPNGSTATFSAPRSFIEYSRGFAPQEYRFMKWSGDSDAETTVAQVKMTSPKTVKALWKTDQTPGIIILASIAIIIFDAATLFYLALGRRR
ncbi:MAG: hypothetical protein QXT81_00750 [Candidatus Bathyarchaeia archaeon]